MYRSSGPASALHQVLAPHPPRLSPPKQVMIELCGKHLDTECGGATGSDRQPPQAPPSRGAEAPSANSVGDPPERPTTRGGTDQKSASPPRQGGVQAPCEPASPESPDAFAIVVGPSLPRRELEGRAPARNEGVRPKEKGASGNPKAAPSSEPGRSSRAVPRGTLLDAFSQARAQGKPKRSQSREASAGAGAPSLVSSALTSCPVCGLQVRADRCSWHLDTECPGVPGPERCGAAEAGPSEGGAGGADERVHEGGGGVPDVEAGGEGGGEKRGTGEEKEMSGELTAMGAELKCPVW